ncbi:transposase [Streptomyces sp. NPDC048508]|uniref:transposase n=1 Tax=Streptomyces sp. NPDC048508 TaxID=3365561 RepID=UPI00371A4183
MFQRALAVNRIDCRASFRDLNRGAPILGRQEFPDLVRHCWRANKLWSGSSFATTVGGTPLSVVRQYIEQQNRPV